VLLNQFDGQGDRAGEDVVERAVDGLLYFFFVAVVGNGDLHGRVNVANSDVGRNTGCGVFARTARVEMISVNWRPCLLAKPEGRLRLVALDGPS
jgi:hypothetical protein